MIQHKFWVTKKTVEKKLGTKEDDCIVSSDAELDAKLELFRSINESCVNLQRLLDQYQERLCMLSQEENALGKFLREKGKSEDAAGKHLLAAGKAIAYSSQQRFSMRGPLIRLHHEVETFRMRAVSDMRLTVSEMEKARTEYRAALSWMKSTGAQLDPDSGRGFDNFRRAQRQVRESKKVFDKLKLDVLQKIDLLAAARCNMFSHALVSYQKTFHEFSSKVAETMHATSKSMSSLPQFEFNILKELCQKVDAEPEQATEAKEECVDKDQLLFFKDDYKDESIAVNNEGSLNENIDTKECSESVAKVENLIDTTCEDLNILSSGMTLSADLSGLAFDSRPNNPACFVNSQLFMQNSTILPSQCAQDKAAQNQNPPNIPTPKKPEISASKKKVDWNSLFAELDPLGNPDTLLGNVNSQGQQA